MNKNTLLLFIDRIISNGSQEKALCSLKELQKIINQQKPSSSDIAELINKAVKSLPEIKSETYTHTMTEEDIEIAYRRALVRIQREEAAQYRGRC